MTYKQDPPFCIQLELVEGCNLRCSFCGLNGIRGKDNNFKHMEKSTLVKLASQLKKLGWNSRIELAMHGEPSFHPNLLWMIKTLRRKLPNSHLMMTSNGGGFLKNIDLIDESLQYLNVLALDSYENVNIVPKLLKKYDGINTPLFYPENKEANPHKRRKIHHHDFVIVKDISKATAGTHASINNHAGSGASKNQNAQGKRCAKPFREISIRHDGSIAVCCNDWRGEYCCGNICNTGIDKIWLGREFQAARKKLYHGLRDFGPCEGCDALSYRPGLLPDQRGKIELSKPSETDKAVIRRVLRKDPLSLPVLRDWEQ